MTTVIRVVHNKENPFVQLNKESLWNNNLSLKAVGLWARCMSRPDNWRFNITELAGKCKEGRRAIDGAIHELIEQRYALKCSHWEKGEGGQFSKGGVEFVFFEFPASDEEIVRYQEEFKKSFRDCCFSKARNQPVKKGENDGDCCFGDCRKSELLIQTETKTDSNQEVLPIPKDIYLKDKRVETEVSPISALSKKKEIRKKLPRVYKEVAPMVFLTEKQEATLALDAKSPDQFRQWIQKLSEWKMHKGVDDSKSDYMRICKWVKRAVADEKTPTVNPPKDPKNIEANKSKYLRARQAYPSNFKNIGNTEKCIFDRESGRDASFDWPAERFDDQLCKMAKLTFKKQTEINLE